MLYCSTAPAVTAEYDVHSAAPGQLGPEEVLEGLVDGELLVQHEPNSGSPTATRATPPDPGSRGDWPRRPR